MRKQACGLILGLLLVTGCSQNEPSNGPSETPTVTSTVTEKPSPIPSIVVPTLPTRNITIDDAYLQTVRDEVPSAKEMSDEQLIKTADSACASARDGDTLLQTVDRIKASGFAERDSAYVVGAAWAAYCPQYLKNLKPGV